MDSGLAMLDLQICYADPATPYDLMMLAVRAVESFRVKWLKNN